MHGFKSAILKKLKNLAIHNMSQGLSNQGFMQEKVQTGDFRKKPSQELKNYFCLGFLEGLECKTRKGPFFKGSIW